MATIVLTEEKRAMLDAKIKFVDNIATSIKSPAISNIADVEYVIFMHKDVPTLVEYLVVMYKGGSKSVRCCSGNSHTAIFCEIAKLINGSYYSEVERFNELNASKDWYKYHPICDSFTFESLIDWICVHDELACDFSIHFNVNLCRSAFGDLEASGIGLDDIVCWIMDHKTATEDLFAYFAGVDIDVDELDDVNLVEMFYNLVNHK